MIGHLFPDPKAHALALSCWGATGSMGFVYVFRCIRSASRYGSNTPPAWDLSLVACLHLLSSGVGYILFFPIVLVKADWSSQIFWFPLILEGLLAALAIFMFRHTVTPNRGQTLTFGEIIKRSNPMGTGLSIPGLILLVYALTTGNVTGWSDATVLGTLVAAVILLVAFVVVEKKLAQYPFVPPHLWQSGNLGMGCALAAIMYAVWQGANYFLTIQLQGNPSRHNAFLRYLLSTA
jgi:hypothetical protein